ncbi:hypothetical protein WY13_03955 [Clostridium ljungdahlii]|uniref:Uncharacterized protein n=1 Tax=Clostridium ljungdahlii TaxID=1538 RepID=A0A168LAF7_9CLOT|nr:hypothetical protein WY13_03955 [Clostridium ljungdahlii]
MIYLEVRKSFKVFILINNEVLDRYYIQFKLKGGYENE